MTELFSLLPSSIQFDSRSNDQLNLHAVHSAGHTARNHLKLMQQSNYVDRTAFCSSSSLDLSFQKCQSHCVKDLNILLNNISQLRNEIAYKIVTYLKSQKFPIIDPMENKQNEHSNENEQEDAKRMHNINIVIDQLFIMFLIEIQTYLINNEISQKYKIITFYQYQNTHKNEFKQLLSFIPYISDIPADGISEISSFNLNGQTKTKTTTAKLLNGGFAYTQDWLSIQVNEAYSSGIIENINLTSCVSMLRGFAINYNLSTAHRQTNLIMQIPDFFKYWYAE